MRDYFCSSSSKAGYVWQPLDLVCQSGFLDRAFELRLMDAAASRLGADDVLREAASFGPDVVYSLAGTANYPGDMEFLAKLHEATGARLFISGDFARFAPELVLERWPFVEGIVMDFTGPALFDYLRDGSAGAGLLERGGESRDAAPRDGFAYPVPRHDLFVRLPYTMPFLGRPFASVLTNYGCPYRCSFCNSGSLGFARRDLDDLFSELDAIHSMGVRNLFVKDMTFNADMEHAKRILNRWLERGYEFRWIGYFRAELMDDELAELLARTRLAVAQVGIETANERVLRKHKPAADLKKAADGIKALNRRGVRVGAHFIFGLPGDDPDGFRRTVEFARSFNFAYASFNAFAPRIGSELFRPSDKVAISFSDPSSVTGDGNTGADGLRAAVASAYREFYIRPRYVLSLLKELKNPRIFIDIVKLGLGVLRAAARSKR